MRPPVYPCIPILDEDLSHTTQRRIISMEICFDRNTNFPNNHSLYLHIESDSSEGNSETSRYSYVNSIGTHDDWWGEED